MSLDWFKPRGYRHFDLPVDKKFAARAMNPSFVARHPFSPLLHYTKSEKRYKKDPKSGVRTITTKDRPIKYSSHRDACILAYYAHQLNMSLEKLYLSAGLSENVIAYRPLGKGNYDFSAEVLAFAKANAPVTILAFDVTGFFDNLDHGLMKQRLKSVLGVTSLTEDWLKVFRSFTTFHYVDLEELKANATFAPRLAARSRDRIAGVEELKAAGIIFHPNPELAKGKKRGIPQGTPISAAASNLYMVDFDASAKAYCDGIGALYRRYSDDIMVVCKPDQAKAAEQKVMQLIATELLEINPAKTERTSFGSASHLPTSSRAAQYLGFTLHEDGPAIRESSLSRQWRKMRRAMKRVRKIASAKIAAGLSDGAHTKKLYRRFSHLKVRDDQGIRTIRNFSSYGRRSASVFGSDEKITSQVKRFERAAQKELANLKALNKPKAP
jgi:RNA-directed DNA polymerase